MKPVIIVNFKTYPKATGEAAVALARICEQVAKERKADIRVAVQAADIYRVCQAVSIPVYAQHVDAIEPGRNTGMLLPEAAKAAGALGTLLNHSERRLPKETLEAAVARAKAAGLTVIICAATTEEGAEVARFAPEFVAVEPPELISGTISVSSADPGLIERAVSLVKAPVLAGAGVNSAEDVRIAMKLGAKGVLIASVLQRAPDAKQALEAMLDF